VLSEASREVLAVARRAAHVDVIIVSGRSLANLKSVVGVPDLTYVGNHGFEIEGPGLTAAAPNVEPYLEDLERSAVELEGLAVPGAWVERKGATISYHLRQVAQEHRARTIQRAQAILGRHNLGALIGSEIVEGRPPVDWHKGAAVLHVLRLRHGGDWTSRVRAIYLGDDATDEEAFRSLKGIGRSVCVTPPHGTGTTLADYSLPDPAHVLQLVRWLSSGGFAAVG
jgi:trehalose 6-phosphate synthase/phosphatase